MKKPLRLDDRVLVLSISSRGGHEMMAKFALSYPDICGVVNGCIPIPKELSYHSLPEVEDIRRRFC